jgi:hypothetical protein
LSEKSHNFGWKDNLEEKQVTLLNNWLSWLSWLRSLWMCHQCIMSESQFKDIYYENKTTSHSQRPKARHDDEKTTAKEIERGKRGMQRGCLTRREWKRILAYYCQLGLSVGKTTILP